MPCRYPHEPDSSQQGYREFRGRNREAAYRYADGLLERNAEPQERQGQAWEKNREDRRGADGENRASDSQRQEGDKCSREKNCCGGNQMDGTRKRDAFRDLLLVGGVALN